MTTFTNRETIRDAIAALFAPYTASGQPLQAVYSNWPNVGTAKGLSPFLIIVSTGTNRRFNNLHTNPLKFRMLIIAMAQASSPTDSTVTRAKALDYIDNLDRLISQVIRDNVDNAAWDNIYFEEGFSSVETVLFEGLPYMTETHTLVIDLLNGTA